MSKTRVGIINVTGYAGAELARILHQHPEVKITQVTGRSAAGKKLSEVFPHLHNINISIDPTIDQSIDFIFSALPHAASAQAMIPFIQKDIPCVDISADFRLKDIDTYKTWYKTDHPCPELIQRATYGLPELHRTKIEKSKLIANPGCYPTGTILGLAPAIHANIINSTDIISDSKSGVSGAGRSTDIRYNFSELNDNLSAYAINGHRHMPEMQQELNAIATNHSNNQNTNITFIPHLAPMTRGILGTHYASLNQKHQNTTQQQLIEIYRTFYKNEPFVTVAQSPPSTKETWGSNQIIINPNIINPSETNPKLVIITALDNLVKGAAGAAVQNMNIMLKIPETTALIANPIYP